MIPSEPQDKLKQTHFPTFKKSYQIIQMKETFPFGQLQHYSDLSTQILVRKKLKFSSRNEEAALIRTARILQSIKNDFLINLHHLEHSSSALYFFYKYAPLTIEKWILDVGDDILQNLKNQMLDLAQALNQKRIFFTFDSKHIGLSEEIQIRYFLGDFTVVEESDERIKKMNLLYNLKKIEQYFNDFKLQCENNYSSVIQASYSITQPLKSAIAQNMYCSVTTRESWTPLSPKTTKIKTKQFSRSKNLHERVQKSKCKTRDILQKLRKSKIFNFE